MRSKKRIPTWSVRPGLEVGAVVTIRKNAEEILRKMLGAVENILKKKPKATKIWQVKKKILEKNISF